MKTPADRMDVSMKQLQQKLTPLEELQRIADAAVTRAETAEAEAASAKQIADAATSLANTATEEAASAKKDALFSKVISILSLLVGVASLAFSFFTPFG